MADEVVINGVASDEQTGESFYDLDQRGDNDARVADLSRKMESLELEKLRLVHENAETKERIKRLTAEIEELRYEEASTKEKLGEMEKEIERSEDARKALEATAARAAELDTEVSTLQHYLISTLSDSDEANRELFGLKRVLKEKGVRVENLERMVESLEREKVEGEKRVRDLEREKVEGEKRVRDLERKVGVLEMKEIEEKSKKVRIEEEMRDRIGEKEREIDGFRKKAEDLESAIAKNGVELEKWMREKLGLEALVKAKSMELKVFRLQKEVEEAEKVIHGLKEKAAEAINGSVNEIMVTAGAAEKGLKLDWPVVAAGSTGAIALAAAVAYMIDVKLR